MIPKHAEELKKENAQNANVIRDLERTIQSAKDDAAAEMEGYQKKINELEKKLKVS